MPQAHAQGTQGCIVRRRGESGCSGGEGRLADVDGSGGDAGAGPGGGEECRGADAIERGSLARSRHDHPDVVEIRPAPHDSGPRDRADEVADEQPDQCHMSSHFRPTVVTVPALRHPLAASSAP